MNVADKGGGTYEISGSEFTNVFAYNESIITIDLSKGSFTEIIEGCFDSCSNLREFTLNSGVRKILSYSFYKCTSLTQINIPESIEYIGDFAFYECKALNLNLGNFKSLTYLGNYSFASSNISSIGITSTLEKILGFTFFRCESLTSANLPETINFIGTGAFWQSYIQNLNIQWENIQIMESYAFSYCGLLQFPDSFEIPNSMKNIPEYLFQYCNQLSSVTLHESIEQIFDFSFYGTNITSIEIPASVRFIGEKAFESSSLITITIHSSDISIKQRSFFTTSLQSIIYTNIDNLPHGAYSGWQYLERIESNVLHLKNGSTIQLPFPLKIIPDYAFAQTSITSINFPSTLTYIGNHAFDDCTQISNITINSNIDLGSDVFVGYFFNIIDNTDSENRIGMFKYKNSNFADFAIPQSIESIGPLAFYYCENLETVHMNEKVNRIPAGCFFGCSSLREINLGHINFFGCQCFKSCSNLHINIDRSNLVQSQYLFGNGCFSGCVIDSIKLPNDFEYLSDYMFSECTITNIVFPSNLKILGESSFYNTNIPDFELPDTVEEFKINSLNGMNITKFKIPPKVKVIPYDCFVNFPNLESVELNNINIIGPNALSSCSKLKKVIIPPSCTIMWNCFFDCLELNELTFHQNLSIDPNSLSFTQLPILRTIILHQDVNIPPHIFDGLFEVKYIFMHQSNILQVGFLKSSQVTIIFLGETDPTDIGTRFTVSSICSCVLTLDTYQSSSFCGLTPHLLSSGGCGNIPKVDIITNYNDSKHDRTLLIHSQFIEYICLMIEFII